MDERLRHRGPTHESELVQTRTSERGLPLVFDEGTSARPSGLKDDFETPEKTPPPPPGPSFFDRRRVLGVLRPF